MARKIQRKYAGMSIDDNRRMVDLGRKCYTQAIYRRREDTAIYNPFYPFERIEDPWPIYQDFYQSREWGLLTTKTTWKSRPTCGKGKVVVENFTTLLTDHDPMIAVFPVEPNDYELAKKINGAFEYWWSKSQMRSKLALWVKDSRKFGLGWLYIYVDKGKNILARVIHPDAVLVDPDCTAEDFDPNYLIYSYKAQVGELKAEYGDAINWDDFNPNWTIDQGIGTSMLKRLVPSSSSIKNPAQSCVVYEFWMKDGETVEWTEEIDGEVFKRVKLANPGGIRMIIAGGWVLDKSPNPYNHGEMPFTPIFAYPESGRFYCAGDIESMFGTVIQRNRMSQLLFDYTVRAGGGFVLIGKNSGLKTDDITTDPLQVLPVKDISQFDVKSFPAPSRHVFNYMAVLDNDVDDVVGHHEISQGENIPGNKTALEVQTLAESDRVRVRMAARVISWAVARVGNQVLRNMAQFKDFLWFVRIQPEAEEKIPGYENMNSIPRFVEFTGEDLFKREYNPTNDSVKITDEMIDFDLLVGDASTLPFSQAENYQLAMELFSAGLIDREAVLETIQYPNYKAILARMAELEAKVSAEESLAAPMGAPMPAPTPGSPAEMEGMVEQPPIPEAMMELLASLPPEILAELMTIAEQLQGGMGGMGNEILNMAPTAGTPPYPTW